MYEDLAILRSPSTHKNIHVTEQGACEAAQTLCSFPVRDGVVCLLPVDAEPEETATTPRPRMEIREFYESVGWVEDGGLCGDTRLYVDTRPLAVEHSRRCMRRLNKYFRAGGNFLLDAGSGPIPYDELMEYHAHFDRRICVDLSVRGLKIAKRKLGDRGICLQGDLTNLPLVDNSVDAVTCNHVLYQIPADLQAKAMTEIWRVLKPGGGSGRSLSLAIFAD